MKASKDWLKQKYLKWSHQQPPFPRAWGSHNIPRCPTLGVSSSHRLLTSSKCARNQPTCQPVISASQIPGNSLLPCWRRGLKRAIPGGPTPAHVPSWQPPHHQLHPCPTPTTASPVLSLRVPQSRNALQKGSFSKGTNSGFTLFFTVINHV